jgi:predicted nucleic acid-binding protein
LIEFLDSSALAKRYVTEPGSQAVRRLLAAGRISVARIVFAEVASALARAAREGVVTEDVRDRLLDQLEADVDTFDVVELRRPLVARTRALVVRHGLRGYDAVQLASAMTVADRGGGIRFWSADAKLVQAARSEGLRASVP